MKNNWFGSIYFTELQKVLPSYVLACIPFDSPMSLTLKPATPRNFKNAFKSGVLTLTGFRRFAGLVLITGPRKLMRSQLSARSSSFIMLLCIPAIVLFVLATVPTMIFQSPEQAAYFYFARTLSQDLSSGFILALSVLCMIFAFVLPAAEADSYTAIRR